MPGELVGESILVKDQTEASQIYNKGCYGYPQKGGGLELDILEAALLSESDRLQVCSEGVVLTVPEIIRKGVSLRDEFMTKYLVYRDLRQRGYIVKLDGGDFDFRVFPRGSLPSNSQTKAWVLAVSERSEFNMAFMLSQAEISERTRKELLLAVVDEEGDLTYYEAERAVPKGQLQNERAYRLAEGTMINDSVLVLDEGESDALLKEGFYGKKIGKYLQLSLIEAAYLVDIERLSIVSIAGRPVKPSSFLKRAKGLQPDFDMRLEAFKDLRARDLVVKTGFKYGTHFRVYEGDPSNHHSKYLVHVVPQGYSTIWAEISRAIRLAHGVKKEILFANMADGKMEYVNLKRVRP
ncbi:MAG: tRNA-splicing endonuclease [Methanomassiliicoccales archaeon PtaU1.Bin124]|nr:MAG: tRNA-splicing endonuclease [Methanomassiliicoccales archaeon PtaU1.Bin124]